MNWQSIAAAARGRHTYVTAHAHYPEGSRLGLAAGVKCFEHATFADDATIANLKAHDAAVVVTLAVVERLRPADAREGLRPEVRAKAARAFEAMSAMVRSAEASGVLVGSGSDLVGPEQRLRWRELVVRASVTSPMDSIMAATMVNSRILRMAGEIGRLAPGLSAELIAGVIRKNSLPRPQADQVAQAFEAGYG